MGRSSLVAVTDAANGQLVGGRYRLGPHVGSGGMGTVWRAHDELLHRDVAVKEVPIPAGLPDPETARLRERYLREARAAARLRHAGVVGVYDVLPEPHRVWIVMEYVNARNLAELLRADGPMPPDRAAGLGLQILDALDHAHRAGVLHRDVKPANVMVCTDPSEHAERAVLTDFGVASVTGDSSLTRTGHLVGSPAYLSPERLTGGTVGPPSDLWSLGCTLFAAVEGKPPFARDEQFAVITAITLEPVPPATRAGNLAPVLAGLLDKDPDHRWDAVRTRAALKRVAEGDPVEQLSATAWGTPPTSGDGPTWWMPAKPAPSPPLPAPAGGHRGVQYGTPIDRNPSGGSPGFPVSGPPVAGHPASAPPHSGPTTYGPAGRPTSGPPGEGSAGYGPVPAFNGQPPAAHRRWRRAWRWLLAAVVVIALAAAAGVFARKSGWLDDEPQPEASTSARATASALPTTSGTLFTKEGQYQLRYPKVWQPFCLTDPAEIKAQGHSGCFFDRVAASEHTDASQVLRNSPYVLVIVGTSSGDAIDQLTATEDQAAKLRAFPSYTRITLDDNVTYGSHTGAVLEFTYEATTVPKHRVRIFRFIEGDNYYEVSLRSPQAEYNAYLPGFQQIANSIQPQ